MDDFTASNGAKVVRVRTTDDGTRLVVTANRVYNRDAATSGVSTAYLIDDQAEALREFFQVERDEALGRWRWPEHPEYVVYPAERGDVPYPTYRECQVVHEGTGASARFGTQISQCWGGYFKEAARAYFAAHPAPAPRPWEDAQPDEVWALTYHGTEQVFIYSGGAWYGQLGFRFVLDHPIRDINISAGRLLFRANQEGDQ